MQSTQPPQSTRRSERPQAAQPSLRPMQAAQPLQRPEPTRPPHAVEPSAPPQPADAPHTSLTIARLAGPVLATVGIGMLVNGDVYRELAGQFLTAYPFVYFSGVLALVAGLAILNAHPGWTADWRSTITALGWVFTGIGMFRIISPQFPAFVAGALVAHNGFFFGAGIVLLALGGFVTFKGYVA